MTAEEWASCRDLVTVRRHVRFATATKRKKWLFDCACCRRIWHLVADERSRRMIEVLERHVDGLVGQGQYEDAVLAAAFARADAEAKVGLNDSEERLESAPGLAAAAASTVRGGAAQFAARAVGCSSPSGFETGFAFEQEAQAAILRDLFGNPFRPVALDPEWLTSDVLTLARGIYDDRAFDRMPILADALQEAGCANDDVLNHCRDTERVHVLGCWLVDLLLGKE